MTGVQTCALPISTTDLPLLSLYSSVKLRTSFTSVDLLYTRPAARPAPATRRSANPRGVAAAEAGCAAAAAATARWWPGGWPRSRGARWRIGAPDHCGWWRGCLGRSPLRRFRRRDRCAGRQSAWPAAGWHPPGLGHGGVGRATLEVADILRELGPGWRQLQRGHLSLAQLKVRSAIARCRSAALGDTCCAARAAATPWPGASTWRPQAVGARRAHRAKSVG